MVERRNNLSIAVVTGPDVQIQEQSVASLALVLYELATNALKCGSLSLPNEAHKWRVSVLAAETETFQMHGSFRFPLLTQQTC
jgi:two-component sensor histidine kinase